MWHPILNAPRKYTAGLAVGISALLLAASPTSAQTLQEQLDQAVAAFGEGNYSSTYWQLEAMELDYGQEPEYLNRTFQSALLPVRGYAALLAERPTDALVYFSELLSQYNPRPGVRAFALYNAAIAQSQTNSLAAAAQTFNTFQKTFPNSNEAALALLQEADLRAEIGDHAEAMDLLNRFYDSKAPQTLRMQARLRALQLAGSIGDSEQTQHILFETDWNIAAMPDIAVLSFAALDAGDLLLNNGLYKEAIRAYRLTLPRNILIEKQSERLEATKRALEEQAMFASSIWKSHSRQLIARLERQLERLENMEDYTPSLYLRSGQAYLLASRYREATILFRTVATDTDFENDIRAEAHYRWILALSEAELWSEARDVAQSFLETHPAHALANSALFLIARAYQSENKYVEAIEVLDELIENYPTDKQAARWLFTRGYNYCALERYDDARESFTIGLERFPKSHLVEQTKLWNSLTYFFERDYKTSLQKLLALKKVTKAHPISPEVHFRIANVYYAERDYETALDAADILIKKFPDHHRYAEAMALRGDIYMGLGQLTAAAFAFKEVPADDSQIYDYATFQAAKIYKALEHYDLLREHLQAYIDRDDAADRPRVSEALYHIGWSLQQEERADEAFPLYEKALVRFGNKPQARAVSSIISAYADLFKRSGTATVGEGLPLDPKRAPSFDTWLQESSEYALAENKLTFYARLTLYTYQKQLRSIDAKTAEATLLSIHRFVPIEQQDPTTLAAVGIALSNRAYESADDYFEQLLNEYPKRFERAAAYYGKAQLAAKSDRLIEARKWLIRFLEETPTHPLAAEARLLAADVLTTQGLYEQASATLNEILQIKEMRGRPHASALAGLARIETELENPKRAIPYWQRIYTLYRAYPELIAKAYWESALLFEEIGDAIAARNTLEEMLRDERLKQNELYALAVEKLPTLEEAARAQSALAIADEITEEVVP
ncbi:MAG: tetratricopeptide repeat protein [Opitutaceae bacterium]